MPSKKSELQQWLTDCAGKMNQSNLTLKDFFATSKPSFNPEWSAHSFYEYVFKPIAMGKFKTTDLNQDQMNIVYTILYFWASEQGVTLAERTPTRTPQ